MSTLVAEVRAQSARLIPVESNDRELTPEEKEKALESAPRVIRTSLK